MQGSQGEAGLGSLDKGIKSACHWHLVLPTDGGPLNLAVAVGLVLMAWSVQRI
jgi:hypothetical protein